MAYRISRGQHQNNEIKGGVRTISRHENLPIEFKNLIEGSLL